MSPLLLGAALGATSAFILDPQRGPRRRALVRDKVVRGVHDGRDFADAASKDLRFRARGIAARARRLRGGAAPDDIVVERVRAKLGRYTSHPGAIEVTASDGRIVLTGDVLAAEEAPLFDAVRSVSGVRHVDNQLRAYPSAEGISSLQGGDARHPQQWELLEENWTPGVRALVGGAGGLLLLYALARGGLAGIAAVAMGATLLARAGVNRPLSGRRLG
jgi:hypothetical protein